MTETKARREAQYRYNQKPEQIKNRESRNKARYRLEKAGKVHKGDHKDVDHRNGRPLDDKLSNLRVVSQKTNRSYSRTKTAHKKDPRS